jgi:hypothetical protein
VALVQGAYASGNFESAKNILEGQNEQGCPLGGPVRAARVVVTDRPSTDATQSTQNPLGTVELQRR